MSDIALIEAATRRALVAEEAEIEGWWLRSSPGLPHRRPNSATTPPAGSIEVDVVDRIVDWYRVRSAPPIIRVLSVSDPGLDRHLDAAGWTEEATTLVMAGVVETGPVDDVTLLAGMADVPEIWMEVRRRTRLGSQGAVRLHEAGRGADVVYALAPAHSPVAVGRAVVDGDLLGLYDIATIADARRRGWGSRVVGALTAWGSEHGARLVYLQVENDNRGAIALYERLGFETLYTYRYRRPPVIGNP